MQEIVNSDHQVTTFLLSLFSLYGVLYMKLF